MNVKELIEENTQTVSGGDLLETELPEDVPVVSAKNEITTEYLDTMAEDLILELTTEETIWEKPIEDYTTEEGLLLIIAVLLLWFAVKQFIGGIFK